MNNYNDQILKLINFANIRTDWHDSTGETKYLEDAKGALESALVYINTKLDKNKHMEAK